MSGIRLMMFYSLKTFIMEKLNYSTKQLEQINHLHLHAVGKLYLKYAGVSSKITAVRNGIVSLNVMVNGQWEKSVDITAKQFINDWQKSPVLQGFFGWPERITAWDVTVYAELNYST